MKMVPSLKNSRLKTRRRCNQLSHHLSLKRLKANVITHDRWRVGPLVRYRSKRDDDVDNAKVAKMREVDGTVEVGAFAGF
ncbi:MAG: MipA/OmpV family protein [Deltaproteobacteria bacterium]|nr:MipA/OmpV family protein [Deltaproteobacteria bacterium]